MMSFWVTYGVHILLCLVLIGLVLLQQGKGADLGATLGGGSQSIFGAAGASSVLIKATTVVAILFMFMAIWRVHEYQGVTGIAGGASLSGSVMEGVAPPASAPATTTTTTSESPETVPVPAADAQK